MKKDDLRGDNQNDNFIIVPNQDEEQSHNSCHFGKLVYWDKYYMINQSSFDWYQTYDGVKDIITQYIRQSDNILNVGCGTSILTEEMYLEGYQNIANIDNSEICIDIMKQKYQNDSRFDKSKFTFDIADVRDMSLFQSKQFNIVIDKGTLDCILCGEYSCQNARKYLSEIGRVLNDSGIYILITYGHDGTPGAEKRRKEGIDIGDGPRKPVLNKPEYEWKVKASYKIFKHNVHENENFDIDDTESYHYIYICKKGEHTKSPQMGLKAFK